jgi:beta-lactamase class A
MIKAVVCIAAAFLLSCTHTIEDSEMFAAKLVKIEADSGGRIGVTALDTGTNKQLQYRADERFPMCSTFKVMLVGAVLKKSMEEPRFLQKQVSFGNEDVKASGYGPITGKNVAKGMSIAELSAAAIQHSDNAAANLLMKELGGLETLNAFARSIGDEAFRLDHWEPELNSVTPHNLRDSSTPAATVRSLQELLLGDTLKPPQREQLATWLKGNTTGNTRIRAGTPQGWVVGDKTGTCGSYGTTNDIGIIWPPKEEPIFVAIYFMHQNKDATVRNDIIASVTQLLLGTLH